MFSDHDEISPSIAAVSDPLVACSMLAVQQQKRLCRQFVDVSVARRGCHTIKRTVYCKGVGPIMRLGGLPLPFSFHSLHTLPFPFPSLPLYCPAPYYMLSNFSNRPLQLEFGAKVAGPLGLPCLENKGTMALLPPPVPMPLMHCI